MRLGSAFLPLLGLACAAPRHDADLGADATTTTDAAGDTGAPTDADTTDGASPGEASGASAGDPTGHDDDTTVGPDGSGGESSAGIDEPEYLAVFHARCSPCHGDDAEGVVSGPSTGPEIRHAHPLLLRWIVRNGDDNGITNAMGEIVGHPGKMTAFDTVAVSDAVLDEMDDWLQSFPQAADGQGLFEDHCSFCHGTSSTSTVEYVSPYHNLPFTTSGNTDTLAEFIAYVRAGHVVDDMGNPVDPSARREYMPPFPPEQLSDAQLTAIEAWVRTQ